MKYTSNLNLKKPEYWELADIEDINENMDVLDEAVASKADKTQVLTNVPANAKFTDTVTTINGKTGVITKADITALGIPAQDTVYTHPSNHPASMITETTTKRFVSDAEKNTWNTVTSKADLTYVNTELNKKVDKISGKGLSTEDYTSAEKTKLSGIEAGAEVNQNAFSNIKVGTTTIAADSKTDTLELTAGTGITLTPDATNDKVTVSVASAPKLTTARTISLSGDVSGSTSFNGSANVTITATVADDSHNHVISNIDGLQAALNGKAEISDIPTKVSQLENDKNYVTQAELGDAGYGDMTKGVYDQNNNGIVDNAEKVNGFTVGTNVPANAKFTDTVTTINGKTGAISKADIVALGIPAQDTVYTHPSSHPASMITESTTKRFVSDAEKAIWNGKANLESPTFTGTPKTTANTNYTTAQLRNIRLYSESETIPALANGEIALIYSTAVMP